MRVAAQTNIAAAALVATQVRLQRGLGARSVNVDMAHVALECTTHYAIDGGEAALIFGDGLVCSGFCATVFDCAVRR
jgi:hypothetical protein